MTDVKEKLVELQLQADLADNVSENTTQHREFTADFMMANGVTVQEWISVKDRLPGADAGKVLCITQAGHYKILQWIETFDCWSDPFGIDFTNFRNGYIAHWMPLPQPPKGE